MISLKTISTKAPLTIDKEDAKAETSKLVEKLADLQKLMYAQRKYSLLVILQGMDASGKDGVIKNVFNGINPAGLSVKSFKKPTEEEMNHDFLWRLHKHTPEKGMIQIFNRSHYEDILIQRVHQWIDEDTVAKRMNHINHFEQLVSDNNTIILKFYMHVSPEKQLERLDERKTNIDEMWKHNPNDYEERKMWERYMQCYEDAFSKCNTPEWNIIPTDNNWYKEYLVAMTCVEALEKLDMRYPEISL